MARETWTGELEQSWVYLIHRSFSWAVLGAAVWAWLLTKRHRVGGPGRVEKVAVGIVISQMVLGVVMAQIHIYSWVQVLHVGLAAILLAFVWLWRFGLSACEVNQEYAMPHGLIDSVFHDPFRDLWIKPRMGGFSVGNGLADGRGGCRMAGVLNEVEPVAFAWLRSVLPVRAR